ncbi:hypothetical protein [Stutzerimonas frequens]|uniref:hypothetical protein n=1 Tax=Stutzerimonas frequens TaxID=2968969 RepID=UPI00105F6EFC|nr:hypothetical protein [Stutzerimonas frequens]QTF57842.1 hypothetical protein J4H94_04700 [Stutzerimonas frequens]
MKKHLIAVFVAAGFSMSSGLVSAAAATAFQGNEEVTGGTGGECALLAENVTLGASANVHGAYACDEATNLVQVAACHEGGSRSQGAACIDLDADTPDAQLPAGCSELGGFSTIPDYKAFFTSSKGGVMQEYSLGGRCSATTITGIDGFSD